MLCVNDVYRLKINKKVDNYMTGVEWGLLSLVIIFGLYMAWNIGANDVANAMGTSVGSGACRSPSLFNISPISSTEPLDGLETPD